MPPSLQRRAGSAATSCSSTSRTSSTNTPAPSRRPSLPEWSARTPHGFRFTAAAHATRAPFPTVTLSVRVVWVLHAYTSRVLVPTEYSSTCRATQGKPGRQLRPVLAGRLRSCDRSGRAVYSATAALVILRHALPYAAVRAHHQATVRCAALRRMGTVCADGQRPFPSAVLGCNSDAARGALDFPKTILLQVSALAARMTGAPATLRRSRSLPPPAGARFETAASSRAGRSCSPG